MNYLIGTISHNTTGVKTFNTTFQPVGARISVGATSNSDTNAQMSVGVTDGVNQICDSWYQDATRGKQSRSSDLVHVLDWNGAAFVDQCVASFDSFNATSFKYNVTTADVSRQFLVEVWG